MSVSADTLRKLAALSLNAEQMAGVLDLLAGSIEADDARKQAQRERTRRARDKQRNVTTALQSRDGNRDDTHGGVTRVEDKTSNSEIEPLKKVREVARAVRLDAGWTLPVEWRRDALDAGLPEHLIDLEAAKMRDWSLSAPKGAKTNWRAAWRNWAREAASRLPKARAGPAVTQLKDTPANAARRRLEALQNERRNGSETDDHQQVAGLIPGHAIRLVG